MTLVLSNYLLINNEIYKSLDNGFEVRLVFLDTSKAFDKVLDKGLLLKLNQNGISRKFLKLRHDFLRIRKKTVVLNGQQST